MLAFLVDVEVLIDIGENVVVFFIQEQPAGTHRLAESLPNFVSISLSDLDIPVGEDLNDAPTIRAVEVFVFFFELAALHGRSFQCLSQTQSANHQTAVMTPRIPRQTSSCMRKSHIAGSFKR